MSAGKGEYPPHRLLLLLLLALALLLILPTRLALRPFVCSWLL